MAAFSQNESQVIFCPVSNDWWKNEIKSFVWLALFWAQLKYTTLTLFNLFF